MRNIQKYINREHLLLFIDALISGGANLFTSGINALTQGAENRANRKFQEEQNRLNREFQSAEAEKQRQYATEMWNKTNEYNDPSAVRERLVAAGLNPNLAMGGGVIGASSASNPIVAPAPVGSSTAPSFSQAGRITTGLSTSDFNVSTERKEIKARTTRIQKLNDVSDALIGLYDKQKNLLAKQADTEVSKKKLLDSDAALKGVVKEIKQLELDEDKRDYVVKYVVDGEEKSITVKGAALPFIHAYSKACVDLSTIDSEITRSSNTARLIGIQADRALRLYEGVEFLNSTRAAIEAAWISNNKDVYESVFGYEMGAKIYEIAGRVGDFSSMTNWQKATAILGAVKICSSSFADMASPIVSFFGKALGVPEKVLTPFVKGNQTPKDIDNLARSLAPKGTSSDQIASTVSAILGD